MKYELRYTNKNNEWVTKTFEGREALHYIKDILFDGTDFDYIELYASKVITFGHGDFEERKVLITRHNAEARTLTERVIEAKISDEVFGY